MHFRLSLSFAVHQKIVSLRTSIFPFLPDSSHPLPVTCLFGLLVVFLLICENFSKAREVPPLSAELQFFSFSFFTGVMTLLIVGWGFFCFCFFKAHTSYFYEVKCIDLSFIASFIVGCVTFSEKPSLTLRLKKKKSALAGVAQWIEHQPANQRVAGSIPSQGTCLGCGLVPGGEHARGNTH